MQSYQKRIVALAVCAVLFASCSNSDEETRTDPTSSFETASSGAATTSDDSVEATSNEEATAAETSEEPIEKTTESETTELDEVQIGLPFGIAQLATFGGADLDPQLQEFAPIQTQVITNPDALRTGFAGGDLDVAVMPTNIAANLYNRGVDVRLAGIVDAQLLHVLGPKGAGWADLEGQSVHLPFQGDVADLLFRSLLKANNVDPDSVDFHYGTALPDLVGAAATGAAEYLVLPEHFATLSAIQAMANGHDLVPILDLQEAWSTQTGGHRVPQIAIVVSGTIADSHPDVVQALTDFAAKNILSATSAPEAAAQLAKATGLPAPAVESVLGTLRLEYRSLADASEDLDLFFDGLQALSADSIGGSVPRAEFFGR